MYIKRVVIKGFKTYRNETVIDDFSPHHNIVIGSNGSGKSNFFAAIRFVLSDDYSKLKREERQGLIHQGSGSIMSASVEIVFYDPTQTLLLPSGVQPRPSQDEVSIRRTVGLKKDDYQLNDRNVTKGDVVRMLESAGFSISNPYNIVPQGRIISLTNAKDKERLQLLEDVVGAKSFDNKLRASLKKMEETEFKRQQIKKEMDELNKKIDEMEEEKKELEKFTSLDKNRKVFQFTLYDRELNDVINQIEKLDSDYNQTLVDSEAYLQELDKRESMIEQVTKSLQNIENTLKIKTTTDLQQAKSLKEEITKKLADNNVKAKDIKTQLIQQEDQTKMDEKNLSFIQDAINTKKNELAKIKPRFEELTKDEANFKAQLLQLQQRQRDLYLKKGRYARFSNKTERDEWIQTEIKAQKEELHNINALQKQIDHERKELEEKLATTETEIEELDDSISGPGITAELEDLTVKLNRTKEAYSKKIDERKELWRNEQKLQTVLETLSDEVKRSERNVNETIDRSLANGIASVKEITQKLKLSEGSVLGTLGELIKVSEKYKRCAEVVGGNSLFNVVVDTDETASVIMRELYRMKGGRVTFIPLNRISNSQNVKYPPNDQASCTPLIKKIKYDPRYEEAVKHVFGKTIVVKDLSQGSKIAKTYKLNAITLDGDRADKRGVLTGGYYDMHKRTRLESLKELKDARQQHRQISEELRVVKHKLETIDVEIDGVSGELRQISKQKETILTDIESLRIKLNTRKNSALLLKEHLNSLVVKAERAEVNSRVVREKIATYEHDITNDFDSELSSREKQELQEIRAKITEAESKLTATTEAFESVVMRMDVLTAELESKLLPQEKELTSKISDFSDMFLTALKEDLDRLTLQREKLMEQEVIYKDRLESIQHDIDALNAEKSNKQKILSKADSQQRLLLKKLDNFQKEAEKYMIKKATLGTRKEELQQRIREVGLLAEDALNTYQNYSSEELLQSLNDVNNSISNMKNVNKRAFENYKKFAEKKEELTERASDLEDSKKSIQDLIIKLKEQKVVAVDRTFNKVSESFAKIFEKLVPRGTAKLIIHREQAPHGDREEEMQPSLDGTETIYTGVSISVSFNSKKNEQLHVEQLSGGQKTLCAIALILAIQTVDPAPFYLFDEIDAALDKQYRTAVAETIKELARNAQFICTTFRTDMLQVADKFFRVKYENKISTVIEVDRQKALNFIRGSNKLAVV